MFRASGRICELCCRVSLVPSNHNINTIKKLSGKISLLLSANVQRWHTNHGRSFTSSQVRRLSDHTGPPPLDLSNDPLVKEWMREMQQDFERDGKKETEQKQDTMLGVQNDLPLEENTSEPGEENKRIYMRQKELLREGTEEREMTKRREENPNEVVFEKRLKVGDNQNQQQSTPKTPLQAWAQFNTPKYEIFDTGPQQIIYDYNEEKLRREEGLVEEEEQEEERKERIHLERGAKGVFDIEELVELLRQENGKEIVVVQVPADLRYVEHLVIVTSQSRRHSNALAQIVHRAYKAKKARKDPVLIVEGKDTDWVAMDMRNIALHIMDHESRESYDLDSLWSVGPEYDDKSQQTSDDLLSIYSRLDPMAGLTASKTVTTSRESS